MNDERKNLIYSYISVKNKFIEHSFKESLSICYVLIFRARRAFIFSTFLTFLNWKNAIILLLCHYFHHDIFMLKRTRLHVRCVSVWNHFTALALKFRDQIILNCMYLIFFSVNFSILLRLRADFNL